MISSTVRFALLLAALALAGCGTDSDGGSAPTDAGSGGSTGDGGHGGGSPGSPSLTGFVEDTAGNPLGGAALLLCAVACYPARADDQGYFEYGTVPALDYKLDVRANPAVPHTYGVVVFPVTIVADQTTSLEEPIKLPDTGAGTTLSGGPEQVAVDAALTLAIDGSELELPIGIDTPYVAGVKVDPDDYPPCDPGSAQLLALWALNPFAAESPTPIGVSVVNSYGLEAGAAASVLVIDHKTGLFQTASTAEVSGDGTVIETAAGTGIDQLSWLGIAAP